MAFRWFNSNSFPEFPYTNFHEANLDYFLKIFSEIWKEWEYLYNNIVKSMTDYDRIYTSVLEMKNDKNLTPEMIVETIGYYGKNDGGGAQYYITDEDTSLYYEELDNGLKAILILEDGDTKATKFGVIGNNANAENINSAILNAIALNTDLTFDRDFVTDSTIYINNNFNNKRIYFNCLLRYTGNDSAIIINNCSDCDIKGNTIYATNGTGIKYIQNDGDSLIQNTNIFFENITAKTGIHLRSETRGILNSSVNVGIIRAYVYGIFGECIDPGPNSVYPTYIGNMYYNINLINAGNNGTAVYFTTETNSNPSLTNTITGAYFPNLSIEGSNKGIKLDGDCKLIKIENLRIFELEADKIIIETNGRVRYVHVHVSSPIYTSQLNIATNVTIQAKPIIIDGGINSPSGYRFAEKIIFGSEGETYNTDLNLRLQMGSAYPDWEFMKTNGQAMEWRCIKLFRAAINNSNKQIKNLKYFSPFGGIDTIYLDMDTENGAVFTLYDGNNQVILDGSTLPSEPRAIYKIQVFTTGTGATYITTKENS